MHTSARLAANHKDARVLLASQHRCCFRFQLPRSNSKLCRISKPGDKLHVVWVTTTGGDNDDAALQTYKDAMREAKVPPSWPPMPLWSPSVSDTSGSCCMPSVILSFECSSSGSTLM